MHHNWDPCCNPAHSWMLEQRIVGLGHAVTRTSHPVGHGSVVIDMTTVANGKNSLHALALAADAVFEEKVGVG